ncbi:MAG: divalent-cation tolerance protein CutA [Euryarchaeota archaeon]|nr:divalent-cation tolerance protein CutA [Euryarchaeota archaeon]
MTAFRWIYITCKDRAEARRIALQVLKKRLAACANWFPVRSLYWWEGNLERSSEVALVLKTTSRRVRPLIAAIKKAHSYKVPCVEALPILEGNRDYLEWVRDESGERKRRKAQGAGRTRRTFGPPRLGGRSPPAEA